MGVALVQSATTGDTTALENYITLGSTPTVGNVLVLIMCNKGYLANVAANGWTWFYNSGDDGGGAYVNAYYKSVTAGEGKWQGWSTTTAGVSHNSFILEVSGVTGSGVADIYAIADTNNVAGTSLAVGPTGTTAIADSMVIAAYCTDVTTGAHASTGSYTSVYDGNYWAVYRKALTVTGTENPTFSWTTSAKCAGIVVVFKGDTKVLTLVEKAKPANFTATPLGVGTGTVGQGKTLYYKMITEEQTANSYYQTPAWWSAVSDEATCVIPAGTARDVQLYWDEPAYTYGSASFYRTSSTGVYVQTSTAGAWTQRGLTVTGAENTCGNAIPLTNANCFAVYTMTTDGAIASLVIGETLTQQTSGATAIVVSDPAGGTSFKIRSKTGTWNTTNNFDGSVSGVSVGNPATVGTTIVGRVVLDTISATTYPNGNIYWPYIPDGLPTLYIDGGSVANPITPFDIHSYLLTAGKTYCLASMPLFPGTDVYDTYSTTTPMSCAFNWWFNIYSSTARDTFLKIEKHTAVFHTIGKFYPGTTGANSAFQIGNVDSYNTTSGGGVYIHSGIYAMYSGAADNWAHYFYASYLGGGFSARTINTYSFLDAKWQWGNAVGRYWDSIYYSTGRNLDKFDIRNSRMITSGAETSNTGGSVTQPYVGYVSGAAMNNYIQATYSDYDVNYKDIVWKYYNNGVYVQNAYSGNASVTSAQHHINPTWYNNTQPVANGQISPVGNAPTDLLVTENFECNFTVIDETDKTPLSNVEIQARNTNGKTEIARQSYIRTQLGQKYSKSATTIGLSYREDENLLPNPSFETGLHYWSVSGSNSALVSAVQKYSGSYSAKVTRASDWGQLYQTVTGLQVGRQYRFTLWVYVPTGATITSVVAACDGQNSSNMAALTRDTWQQATLVFTASSSTVYPCLSFGAATGDFVYCDFASLVATDTGYFTSGDVIRVNGERLAITAGTYSSWAATAETANLTVTRSYDGSTANYIGKSTADSKGGHPRIWKLWERDYTNSVGVCPTFTVMTTRWDYYDVDAIGNKSLTKTSLNPITFTFRKAGYEDVIIPVSVNQKMTWTISMRRKKSLNQHCSVK